MKLLLIAVSAAAASALGGSSSDAWEASARGGFQIPHLASVLDGGIGSVTFEIAQQEGATKGEMVFAAEGHASARGAYPHVVIRVPTIPKATFVGNRVDFEAQGTLHEVPVTVVAHAIDGASTLSADYFCIKVYGRGGDMVYHAMGHLSTGDIRIGGPR
jgi:hypothetical protein